MPPRILTSIPDDPLEGLPLQSPTPQGWADAATKDIDALLADHAHCELKAASTAMSLAGRFAEFPRLVEDMAALAHEEIRHFERVHEMLRARGKTLPRVGPDRYVREMKAFRLPKHAGTTAMLDTLVLCGFVEARSCERFRLLARAPLPEALQAFYAELAGAESRHHEIFFEHGAAAVGAAISSARVLEFGALEARLIRSLPLEPRIH